MTTSKIGESAFQALWIMLALTLALAPLHPLIGGAVPTTIVLMVFAALALPAQNGVPSPLMPALRVWCIASAIALASQLVLSAIWHHATDVSVRFKIFLPALACYFLVTRIRPKLIRVTSIESAAAVTCLSGLLIAASRPRDALPENSVPWAIVMCMIVALLFPLALNQRTILSARWRWILATLVGVGAVLASQTRGAYGVIFWIFILFLWTHRHGSRRRFFVQLAGAIGVMAAIAYTAVTIPSDRFHLRQAWQEASTSMQSGNYNTSVGSRMALYQIGIKAFEESPWIGIGIVDAKNRIRHAEDYLPSAKAGGLTELHSLNNFHSDYLHMLATGGVLGFLGFASLLLGLLLAAWRLRKVDSIAAQQLCGVTLMHASGSLSAAISTHNYDAAMLAACVSVIFLMAHGRSAEVDSKI